MIQENVLLEVEKRTEMGKNAANRLRASDLIPAVLYGGGKDAETLLLQVPRKSLTTLLRKGLHDNAIFQLRLKGTDEPRHVMIRDLSVEPVSRKMLHIDFVRILMDKKIRLKVIVECVGIAAGVKEGGILDVVTRELFVECLPGDIPATIKIDVSELKVHDSFRVSDLAAGDPKIKVLEPSDRVIVHVAVPKVEEVVAVAGAVAGAVAPGSEPEVIKKGKKDEAVDEKAKPGAKAPAAAAAKPAGPAKKK